MVIGGLMTNQTNKTVTKLPFLGDLPLIGGAFRSVNRSKDERELIIFLTPHIIDAPASFQATCVNDAAGRIEEVDQTLNTYEFKRN